MGKRRQEEPAGGKGAGADGAGTRCPLCKKPVPHDGDAPAALNRHFETDCTWRHTNRSPVEPRRKP